MLAKPLRSGVVVLAVALLLSACGGSTVTSSGGNGSAESVTVKIAEWDDPAYAALLYPLRNGLIETDGVDVEIDLLPIPGLNQAVSTQQYDLINAAATAPPQLVAGGLPIRIIAAGTSVENGAENYAIVTKSSSDISDFADLKGKSLAVESVAANNTLQLRLALHKQAGLDVATEGGDITFLETPGPQMRQLLDAGEVDAVYLYGPGLYELVDDPSYRNIGSPQAAYGSAYDTEVLVSTLVSFQSVIDEKRAALESAVELLRESVDYALAHADEIYPAVEEEYSIAEGYLDWLLEYNVTYPDMTDDELVDTLTTLYGGAAEIGALEPVSDVASLLAGSNG